MAIPNYDDMDYVNDDNLPTAEINQIVTIANAETNQTVTVTTANSEIQSTVEKNVAEMNQTVRGRGSRRGHGTSIRVRGGNSSRSRGTSARGRGTTGRGRSTNVRGARIARSATSSNQSALNVSK